MGEYSWYRTGSVDLVQGNILVNGITTTWVASQIQPGDEFSADNMTSYEVTNILGDTQLQLDRPFAAVSQSAASYSIRRNFSPLTATLMTNVQELLSIYRNLVGATPVQFVEGTPDTIGLEGLFALDVETNNLFVYHSGNWLQCAGSGGGGGGTAVIVGTVPPTTPGLANQLYFDKTSGIFYVYTGGVWIVEATGQSTILAVDDTTVLVDRLNKILGGKQVKFLGQGSSGSPDALFMGATSKIRTTGTLNTTYSDGSNDYQRLSVGPFGTQVPHCFEIAGPVVNPAVGGYAIDFSKFTSIELYPSAGADLIVNFINYLAGSVAHGVIILHNAAQASSVNFGSVTTSMHWDGGTPPTWTTGRDEVDFQTTDGVNYTLVAAVTGA